MSIAEPRMQSPGRPFPSSPRVPVTLPHGLQLSLPFWDSPSPLDLLEEFPQSAL